MKGRRGLPPHIARLLLLAAVASLAAASQCKTEHQLHSLSRGTSKYLGSLDASALIIYANCLSQARGAGAREAGAASPLWRHVRARARAERINQQVCVGHSRVNKGST